MIERSVSGNSPNLESTMALEPPAIVSLTGVSGAGKTTLIDHLEQTLSDGTRAFLYFDSLGVPSEAEMIRGYGSGRAWQEAMTFKWIETIISNYMDKREVYIEGQVDIGFIFASFEKHHVPRCHVILVHCEKDERHQRLKEQRAQPHLVNAEMDNWAEYLLRQAQTLHIQVVDTSEGNIDQSLREVIEKTSPQQRKAT